MRSPAFWVGAALRHRWNACLLAGTLLAAMWNQADAWTWLLVAELGYVGSVPWLPAFRRRIEARDERRRLKLQRADVRRRVAALAPEQRRRYGELAAIASRIHRNHGGLGPMHEALRAGLQRRIDALLDAYLRLLATLNDQRRFLGEPDRAEIERQLAELEARPSASEAVREVQERRIAILRKRLDRFVEAEEGRELILQQLASIEELLRLLHEQSITLRDPERVSRQLEVLAAELDETESTMRDVERYLALGAEAALLAR